MVCHREHDERSLPGAVTALLGADIVDHPGAGACRVVSGGGLVAKVGPAEVVAREAALLDTHLPLTVPMLVDFGPGWLVMTAEADDEGPWRDDDLRAALSDLARLHDEVHLFSLDGADALLRRPFSPEGVDALLAPVRPRRRVLPDALADLLDDSTPIVEAAAAEPETVLHGDPWPGNILRPAPGRRVWVDWEMASLGPAAADVASWLGQTQWHTGAPTDGHLEAYLTARSMPIVEARFERALDAAIVLWFLAYDVPHLASGQEADVLVSRACAAAERLVG
jgi:hypothetical protein